MEPRTKIGVGCAAGVLAALAGMLAIPFLVIAASGPGTGPCVGVEVADDGTPSILGPSTLSVSELRGWWESTGRSQPARLTVPVADLIALYISEGDTEGVRGDYALAQAILETGYFANTDTSINNFAGIAHYDGTASGIGFPDAPTGVRAHIQLLKKYAAGNDVPLAQADVSPNAGASSTTWGGLAGTWASSTEYWTNLQGVYQSMANAARGVELAEAGAELAPGLCPSGALATSGEYALPVERVWYDQHPEWFTKPHHTYPAADIPVPTGTPIYSAAGGSVASTPTGGRCGIGVIINGHDGAQYIYCHGLPGSHAVTPGETVDAGQFLMLSASTGNSTGPHLHFGIRINGQDHCPQPLLVAVAEGNPVDISSLPTSDCYY